MINFKAEIEQVVAGGRFTTKEAKRLLGYDWRSLTSELPLEVRQEAEVVYHQIMGSIEEVDEGYVEDANDQEMLNRLKELLKLL